MKKMHMGAVAALVLALNPMFASPVQAGIPTQVSDHVWNDGQNSVIWGPGIWTRDGVPIGTTFPGGVVHPGGIVSHDWDSLVLPVTPNDFHFDVDILFPVNPVHINVWASWTIGNPDMLWIEFITFDTFSADNFDVMLDLTLNTAVVFDLDNLIEVYNGSADPFLSNGPLPGGFTGTGASRMFHIPAPGALTLMGLAGLTMRSRRRRA